MKKLLFIIIVFFSNSCVQGMSENEGMVKDLKENIKALVSLSATDRYFNSFLKSDVIGGLYKHHDQQVKDTVLQEVIDKVSTTNYQVKRLPILILIHAGASANTKRSYSSECVLLDAVLEDDIHLAALLFQHGANPNIRCAPILFYVKTVQLARMFIDNGVSLRSKKEFHWEIPNVLWRIIHNDTYPAELLDTYLVHGADVTQLNEHENNMCLLHWLTQSTYYLQRNNDNFLKKATTVLNAMKDMINTRTRDGRTPLDYAEKSFVDIQSRLKKAECNGDAEKAKFHGTALQVMDQLIILFKNHGASTGDDLRFKQVINKRGIMTMQMLQQREKMLRQKIEAARIDETNPLLEF